MIATIKKSSPLLVILSITLFFSTYKLTESPKTWMDEGIITQVAKNISEYSRHALQVGPDEFVSAGIVSTGYTVTFPISLSFDMFGVGLLQARAVMVLFILLLIILTYYYLKNNYGGKIAFLGSLLLSTFSPIYGHGKNVLGEIPGMVFFMSSLFFLDRITKSSNNRTNFIFLGLFLGLTFSTKSIFVLLIPALFTAYLWQVYKKEFIWNNNYFYSLVSFFLVVIIWFFVQFQNDSFLYILSIYSNPHSVPFFDTIKQNINLFFTDLQPIYYLGTLSIWCTAFIWKEYKKEKIAFSEVFAILFSVLVFLAFLRTAGFYRYFFLSQFLSLLYLPPSLEYLFKQIYVRKIITIGIVFLVGFHLYQTSFNSWVADYYKSSKSQIIYSNMENIDYSGKVIFYQTPELIIFSEFKNYYQYIDIAKNIKIGEGNLKKINDGFFDKVIVNQEVYADQPELFYQYKKITYFDQYAVLGKISN